MEEIRQNDVKCRAIKKGKKDEHQEKFKGSDAGVHYSSALCVGLGVLVSLQSNEKQARGQTPFAQDSHF